MIEHEGLYYKYRVFKEPEYVAEHPTGMTCLYTHALTNEEIKAEEVNGFVFVLKPDTDPHAVTALAAYALAVREDNPPLCDDLWKIVEEHI